MFKFLVLVFVLINFSQCARILGVFQMPSYSHQVVFQPIWKELSLRGHQVTVVTPLPLKDKSLTNLTEIDVGYLKQMGIKFRFLDTVNIHEWPTKKIQTMFEANYLFAEEVFKNPEFKKIYTNPKNKFDLILLQSYIGPAFLSLGPKYNAPMVGINSMNVFMGTHFAIGNPHHPALYADKYTDYQGDLTFLERWYNTYFYLWNRFYIHFIGMPKTDAIVRKYLGNDIPYLGESAQKLDLLFTTTNPILYAPRPQVPTHIEIGRLHVQPPKPLPQDIKQFLDNAKEGAVYVSLGSNVLSSLVPEDFRQRLITALGKLPYKVLWKYEEDNLKNIPPNIFVRKWYPQLDVLAHPNIKAFLMQCGLQSLEECFSQNIPMVCIPFISDQLLHIKRLVKYNASIGLDYRTATADEIKDAVVEVIKNKKYKENVKKINDLWNDEPMKPLEKAIWWIEYVLRHKGTAHLHTPYGDLPWYQFFLLDVIGATLLVIIIPIVILVKIVKSLTGSKDTKTGKAKKTKKQ